MRYVIGNHVRDRGAQSAADGADEHGLAQHQQHDLHWSETEDFENSHLGAAFAHADADGIGDYEGHGHQDCRGQQPAHCPEYFAKAFDKGLDARGQRFALDSRVDETAGAIDLLGDPAEVGEVRNLQPDIVHVALGERMPGAAVRLRVGVDGIVQVIAVHDGEAVVAAGGKTADNVALQVDAYEVDAGHLDAVADLFVREGELLSAEDDGALVRLHFLDGMLHVAPLGQAHAAP